MFNITITTLGGNLIKIIADENSTIKELKKKYVEKNATEIEEELDAIEIEKAVLEAEYNLKLMLGTLILDDNKTLKELLEGDVLEGEVTINAIKRPPLYAECFREIDSLDLILSTREKLVKIEAILRIEIDIDIEDDTPILASSDKDIVLAAVQQIGLALQYASPELKDDREIVLAAVQENGAVLWYASEDLRKVRDVVLEAVQQNGWALMHAATQF